MFDLLSVIIGLLTGILIIFMYFMYTSVKFDIAEYNKINPKIANDLVGEKVYCPECQSYNIRLVDPNSNLVWLKGLIPELDYYECLKCGHVFSDEN